MMMVGASIVIGGVRIRVVVWISIGGMVETDGDGRRVVAGVTEGVSGIGIRTEGSNITKTVPIKELSEESLRS
ncbi:hypothetical protein Tco_1340188 [Tanacetum coccineum]